MERFEHAVESQSFHIEVEQSLINATVGRPVLLSVMPSVNVTSGTWKRNGERLALWLGTTTDISLNYRERMEVLFPNASLLLKAVSFSDNGEYTVNMISFRGRAATARVDLRVFEPISSAYITSNVSNPVRENDSVCLTCIVVGNCTRRVWSFNGAVVESSERIILSSGNVTLTIIGVHRRHSGEYQCRVSSPVSEAASEPYFLHIGSEY
uniref:cell adhesion molecule CEACAM6-like n=1 Tax=Pristiophorus japonicus TaxID=55135 RepID=UPI00398E5017